MAAQFTQPGDSQHSSDKPTTDSVTTSSFMSSLNGIGLVESKSSSRLSSAGRSGDVSTSSGVGSSLYSLDYLHQSGSGGGMMSSSAITGNNTGSSRIVRQQPDSLPRVGTVSDRDSLLNTQSSGHAVTGTALSHPKPLFDVGTTSLDRYVGYEHTLYF